MLSTVALAHLVTAAIAVAPVDAWPRLHSSEGEFTVKMPGPVDETVHDVDTDVARLQEHTFTCQAGTAFYQVSFVDLPSSLVSRSTGMDLLSRAQMDARLSDKTLVFNEGSGKSDGSVWRRYRVQAPRGAVVSHMLVLSGRRLFHLEVVAPPTSWRKSKPKDFFDSFEFASQA